MRKTVLSILPNLPTFAWVLLKVTFTSYICNEKIRIKRITDPLIDESHDTPLPPPPTDSKSSSNSKLSSSFSNIFDIFKAIKN